MREKRAQPFCVIFFRQYDWHPGVNLDTKRRGRHKEKGTGQMSGFPTLPRSHYNLVFFNFSLLSDLSRMALKLRWFGLGFMPRRGYRTPARGFNPGNRPPAVTRPERPQDRGDNNTTTECMSSMGIVTNTQFVLRSDMCGIGLDELTPFQGGPFH